MAHDPRIFVGPQMTTNGTGHLLHVISANSPSLPAILQQTTLRELTTSEYAAWDSGDRTHKAIEAHGR
jgi:hypothetical protein